MRQTAKPFVREVVAAKPRHWLRRKEKEKKKVTPELESKDIDIASRKTETLPEGSIEPITVNEDLSSDTGRTTRTIRDKDLVDADTSWEKLRQKELGNIAPEDKLFSEEEFKEGLKVDPEEYKRLNIPMPKIQHLPEAEYDRVFHDENFVPENYVSEGDTGETAEGDEQSPEEPSQEGETADEDGGGGKPPPVEVDTSVIEGRSDREILQDAKTIAIEMHNFAKKASEDAVEAQRQVEQLLGGNEVDNLKNLIEQQQPGATKKSTPEGKSLFDETTEELLDILASWSVIINELSTHGRTFAEILHKLRLPQFRLPAWLESYATNVAAKTIKEQRRKRFENARERFVDSKRPMTNSQKRFLSELLQNKIDKLEANPRVVENFFTRIGGGKKFLQEYTKSSELRKRMDEVLMNLNVNFETKDIYEKEVPEEIIKQAKNELRKVIRTFEAQTNKSFDLQPQQLDAFVDHYVKNRGPILQSFKQTLETQGGRKAKEPKPPAAADLLKRLTRLGQTINNLNEEANATGEEQQAELQQAIQAYVEKINQIVFEFIGSEEMLENTEDNEDDSTAIFNAYARIMSLYFDPHFAPSIAALGHKWMQEHPEGSKQSYFLVEATREGDGERMLSIFDPKTGLGSRTMRSIGDFVKQTAVPGLHEAMFKLEELGNVNTSYSDTLEQELYGEQQEEKAQQGNLSQLIANFVQKTQDEVGELETLQAEAKANPPNEEAAKQYLAMKGCVDVATALGNTLLAAKDLDQEEQRKALQESLSQMVESKAPDEVFEISAESGPQLYFAGASDAVIELNQTLTENGIEEFAFSPREAMPQSVEEEAPVEEAEQEADSLQRQTMQVTSKAQALIQKMIEAAKVFTGKTSFPERYEAAKQYFTALREIEKMYRPLIEKVNEQTTEETLEGNQGQNGEVQAHLRGFVKAYKQETTPLTDFLLRPSMYTKYLEQLKLAVDNVEKVAQEELVPNIFDQLSNLLDPGVIRKNTNVPGSVNIFEDGDYQALLENVEKEYAKLRGISLTSEAIAAPTIVERLAYVARRVFAEQLHDLLVQSGAKNAPSEQEILQDEKALEYLSKFDDQIAAENPNDMTEEELKTLTQEVHQEAARFAQGYFQKLQGENEETVNPQDEEEFDEAVGENHPKDNPQQTPANEDGTQVQPKDTGFSSSTAGDKSVQRTVKSRIDVNRTNRLIALHKIQRAVRNQR